MSKIFTNKKIWQKIAVILLIVLLFQFIAANPIMAADDDDGSLAIEWGGKLLSPVMSLLVTIGDGIMSILHSAIMGIDGSLMHADLNSAWWDVFQFIIGAIIAAAVGIGLFLTGGWLAVAAAAAVTTVASVTTGSLLFVTIPSAASSAITNSVAAMMSQGSATPGDLYLPTYSYSPEEIFKGNILLFNVDFFGEPIYINEHRSNITDEDGNNTGEQVVDYYYYTTEDGETVITSKQDSAQMLQSTISSWYSTIRNICLVAMLSVLVYIGIRMLLSSVASDKAKYLTMLKDWFVGLCLLFLMHYIMAFSVTMVQKLTDIVATSVDKNVYQYVMKVDDDNKEKMDKLGEFLAETTLSEDDYHVVDENGQEYYVWTTNLMGYLRLALQFNTSGSQYIGLAICFLILVIFTLMFTFTYLKRLLYMAFLTIIAPLVALTYCIDKVSDGSAQGFDKWLKEYIFNLLIQPMHLLLYFILVTSAFELAGENVVYSLVAIGFMLPAEKLLRSLFGFQKADTAPLLAGPAGTAVMFGAVNKVSSMLGKGFKGHPSASNSGGSKSGSSSGALLSTRTHNFDKDSVLASLPSEQTMSKKEQSDRLKFLEDEGKTIKEMEDEYNNGLSGKQDEDSRNYIEEQKRKNAEEKAKIIAAQQAQAALEADQIRMANAEQQAAMEDTMQSEPEKLKGENAGTSSANIAGIPVANRANEGEKKKIARPTSRGENAKKRFKSAMGAVGAVAKEKGPKAIGKAAAGAMVGIPAGAAVMGLGTAAAIAAGDPSKVWAAAGIGATAGYAAGKSVASSSFKPSDYISQDVKDAYDSRYYDSPEAMQEKAVKEKLKDDDLKAEIANKIGATKTKELYDNKTVEQFIRNGRTSADDIIAGHNLIEKGYAGNVEDATAIMDTTESLMGGKNPQTMTKKNRTEISDTLNEKFMKAYGGDEERAKRQTKFVMTASQAYLDAKAGKNIGQARTNLRLPNKK